LAPGNQWIYRKNVINTQGKIIFSEFDTIRIQVDAVVGGESWYDFPNFEYCSNRLDGLWSLYHEQTQDHKDTIITELLWKYPANAKDTTKRGALVTKDTLIQVPYGCYLADEYIFLPYTVGPSYPSFNRWFMVPGIGMVRLEEWGDVNIWQYDLVSAILH
jgi:hypothetical protein